MLTFSSKYSVDSFWLSPETLCALFDRVPHLTSFIADNLSFSLLGHFMSMFEHPGAFESNVCFSNFLLCFFRVFSSLKWRHFPSPTRRSIPTFQYVVSMGDQRRM